MTSEDREEQWVCLVDSSDVRGLGGGMDVVLVASSGSMRVVWQHKYIYGMCRVFLVGETFV